ncbi:MAG: hypothetical protein KF708_12235 [Pirellulales bacterium]|nr:hypothetical protein [Pirellulales bacterium]
MGVRSQTCTIGSRSPATTNRPSCGVTIWSPNAISYSGNNRTHMIRIPGPGWCELRLPDGAANPYLLAAVIAEAGHDGIANRRDPGKRFDTNVYWDGASEESLRTLPDNLLDALRAFERSEMLREGLGPGFAKSYLKLKRAEWRAYARHVSSWEVEHTLAC